MSQPTPIDWLPAFFAASAARCRIEIDDHDMRAFVGKQLCRRSTDGAGAAGDQHDLAGQRLRLVGGELRLLQRPVFQLEEIGLGKRPERADGFGAAHRLDPHLADIGSDLRVLQRAAMAEHAKARHQRQARHRVEHGALHIVARVIGLEIVAYSRRQIRRHACSIVGLVVAELGARRAPAAPSARS